MSTSDFRQGRASSDAAPSALLPCPFCGEQPKLLDLAGWEIQCSCGCDFWLALPAKGELIAAWNRRPVAAGLPTGASPKHPHSVHLAVNDAEQDVRDGSAQSTAAPSAELTDDGGPAFPAQDLYDSETREATCWASQGMKLRDYFAAKAMQGLMANPGGPIQANGMNGWNFVNCERGDVAELAYRIADDMLKARSRHGSPARQGARPDAKDGAA